MLIHAPWLPWQGEFLSACLSVALFLADERATPGDLRAQILEALREQEARVVSAQCEFSVVVVPSQVRDVAEKIQEALRFRGEDPSRYKAYLATDALVHVNSWRARWWRKGLKERWESRPYFEKPSHSLLTTTVFNGSTVTTLSHDKERRIGKLETVESAHWNSQNRLHPFTLLYEYYGAPWSAFLEDSENWQGAFPDLENEGWIIVKAVNRNLNDMIIELAFDEGLRLRERRIYSNRLRRDPTLWLNQKHVFYDYEYHQTRDGQVIPFPRRAEYISYAGVLPDGSLVKTCTDQITIHHIEFNVDIPDELFELELPKDIPIYDAVHTKGWINRPVEVGPTTKSRITIFFIINGVLFAVLLILAGVLYYRHRRRVA